MTNTAYHNYIELTPEELRSQDYVPSSSSWWHRQSIRFKTTVFAIALGTIPTLTVGATAYYFAADSIARDTTAVRQAQVSDLQDRVNLFVSDRFKDIQMIATLPILSDAKLREVATSADKSAALQKIQETYGVYSSIAVFDERGDFVAKTDGKALGNHFNRSYIQAAIKADGAIVSQPIISTSSGEFSIYTAAPIKDNTTGKTIGFVRARIPVKVFQDLLQTSAADSQYYLLNNRGEILFGSEGKYVVETKSDGSQTQTRPDTFSAIAIEDIFPDAQKILNSSTVATGIASNSQTDSKQFITYAPGGNISGLPELDWQAVMTTDTDLIFASQRKLRLVFAIGSGLVALGVGAIAYTLAKRLLQPILQAAAAVREIGAGDFNTRLKFAGTDEIAELGKDINLMAVQLANFVREQTNVTQRSEILKNITLRLVSATKRSEILDIAVTESFQIFNADRLVYYQFDEGTALAVAEHLADKSRMSILDTELPPELVAEYTEEMPVVEAIDYVERANLSDAKQQYLSSLGIKSCLIATVIAENKLEGLLMVYQSFAPLPWLEEEVELITQVATQIVFATTRLKFLEQQQLAEAKEKSAKEAIQERALSLLEEIYDVSNGNLTIRARVTEDEIGTIADSYNSTIESLQKLAIQAKAAASEVKSNTSINDEAVQSLAAETVIQGEAISQTIEELRAMGESIKLVADRAAAAEDFVKQATSTIEGGDWAINQTVAEIDAVQHTVVQTAAKAEKLGESSQEISQAVNLIGRFAAQTHLLALKASIEAARAGEQGKGFAVIANEVRSLATQSAEATAQIATLVNKIQLETGEVVLAMNQGAEQIASGNKLVQQTRQSLTQIEHVGQEIGKLVESISQAAEQQSATTAKVNKTMVNVAASAWSNSQSATKVSTSSRQLSKIAEKLQSNIDKFKT